MFDGMMPDMPEDRKPNPSAHLGATENTYDPDNGNVTGSKKTEATEQSTAIYAKQRVCRMIENEDSAQVLNILAGRIHILNSDWWIDLQTGKRKERDFAGLMMMAVTELSEAVEGNRKSMMDDKLKERRMDEVEIADAIIRLLDTAAALHMDIGGALVEKLRFNANREDHSRAHRLTEQGKKY